MDNSKIKKSLLAALAFIQSELILASNPLNTINEATHGDGSGGAGGSFWLLSPLITFPLAIWLVISESSPMHDWAEDNKGLAYLFIFFLPIAPMLLYEFIK